MKRFLKKHPAVSRIISFIYRIISFNKIRINKRKNKLKYSNCYLKKCIIIIHGKNNIVEFEELCNFKSSIFEIYGNNNTIKIGKKVYGNEVNIYIEDDKNYIEIGDSTIFAGKIHLALTEGKKIIIGKNCLLSNNIIFRTGDSHSILSTTDKKRINLAKDIVLGNHVWITEKVTFLKGSQVGNDSVVASNSVVTKKFDIPNVIIGGQPAKIIKEKITWDNRRL